MTALGVDVIAPLHVGCPGDAQSCLPSPSTTWVITCPMGAGTCAVVTSGAATRSPRAFSVHTRVASVRLRTAMSPEGVAIFVSAARQIGSWLVFGQQRPLSGIPCAQWDPAGQSALVAHFPEPASGDAARGRDVGTAVLLGEVDDADAVAIGVTIGAAALGAVPLGVPVATTGGLGALGGAPSWQSAPLVAATNNDVAIVHCMFMTGSLHAPLRSASPRMRDNRLAQEISDSSASNVVGSLKGCLRLEYFSFAKRRVEASVPGCAC